MADFGFCRFPADGPNGKKNYEIKRPECRCRKQLKSQEWKFKIGTGMSGVTSCRGELSNS